MLTFQHSEGNQNQLVTKVGSEDKRNLTRPRKNFEEKYEAQSQPGDNKDNNPLERRGKLKLAWKTTGKRRSKNEKVKVA